MSLTGGRSKDTPRYRRGIRPARLLVRAVAIRVARQPQSLAVFVKSEAAKYQTAAKVLGTRTD